MEVCSMKKLLLLLLLLCLVPCALAEDALLTEDDFTFRLSQEEDAPVFRLGEEADALLAAIEQHTGMAMQMTFEDQDCMLPGMTREYMAPDESLVLATRPLPGNEKANTLETIQVLTEDYVTFRGAKVGMTLEEIAALYGDGYALDYDTAFYSNGPLEPQMMFFFDLETWKCIGWMIFRNMVI